MEPTPTTGTTLEIIGPYLAYGVELAVPSCNYTGRLMFAGETAGIPFVCLWVEKRNGACHNHPEQCLPVLKPFSALCDPLPDKTVPAVEVAKMQDRFRRNIFKAELHPCDDLAMFQLWERTENGTERIFSALHSVGFWRDLTSQAADYLRSQHFAVNLEPHQFIPKI